MAMEDSIIELFGKLCSHQLHDSKRAHLIQPKFDRGQKIKIMKRKLHNTLFDSIMELNGKRSSKAPPVRKEIDRVLCHAFNLRLQRKFSEANKLEELLEKLLIMDKDSDGEIMPVLAFISALIDSKRYSKETPVTENESSKILSVYAEPHAQIFLPDGPLLYGDSKLAISDRQFYMHYPREIFEYLPSLDKESEMKTVTVFDLQPGSSLSGNGLFNVKGYLDDKHEHNNRFTLFGALVQSKVKSLDVKLELPEFTNDNFVPEIKIPQTISLGQLSEDEGFVETKSEMSCSVTSVGEYSPDEENIWEKALSYTLNRHYTWERIGCEAGKTENSYMTEAGTEAFDQLCVFKLCQSVLLLSETVVPTRTELTMTDMVRDVINLMLGIPSKTFIFDFEEETFLLSDGVFVSGHSTESLSHFLQDFIHCGSNYRKLEQFSEPLSQDSFYEAGLVFQAFTTAIRKVLQHYRASILSASGESTLMEIKCLCHRLFNQIDFLEKLTQYRIKVNSDGIETQRFPKGIELISYLYKETLETNSTDIYPMMLSLLQTTCGPLTLFLQNWVFHGIYQDLYGEFTIQVNPRYLECRDRQYWTQSYIKTTKNVEDCVPVFLSDLASDIIVCGKALNLLKLCCPDHFMCNVSDKDIPRVTITFSDEDLISIDIQSQVYASRMKQIARQLTITRKEKLIRMEKARLALAEKAHLATAKQMKHFQDILTRQKTAEVLKKRKEFKRLKDQMQEDLLRRASEDENAKAEDKKYMDAFNRREEAMTEEEQLLEDQAREEIIAYYKELGDEAARREQKALWKVKRARLEIERVKFLMDDADRWRKEMDEAEKAESLINESDQNLPSWAHESNSSTRSVDDLKEKDNLQTLQEDNKETLPHTNSVFTGEDVAVNQEETIRTKREEANAAESFLNESDPNMPSWALESNSPTRTVDDLEEKGGVQTFQEEDDKETLPYTNSGFTDEDVAVDQEETIRTKPEEANAAESFLNESDPNLPSWALESNSPTRTVSDLEEEDSAQILQEEDNKETLPYTNSGFTDEDVAVDQEETIRTKPEESFLNESDSNLPSWALESNSPTRTVGDLEEEDSAQTLQEEDNKQDIESKLEGLENNVKSDVDHPDVSQFDDGNEEKSSLTRSPIKTSIKMNDSFSASVETEPTPEKAHIKLLDSARASKETTEVSQTRTSVKTVNDKHVTLETVEEEKRQAIKSVADQHFSQETTQSEERPHIKTDMEKPALKESEPGNERMFPRMKPGSQKASDESKEKEWKIKPESIFGHSSQMSQNYRSIIPKLKQIPTKHVNFESNFKDYSIKPRIRISKTMSASKESDGVDTGPKVRQINPNFHPSKESTFVDEEKIRTDKFKERNVFGHASDSSVQKLLYGSAKEDDLPKDISEFKQLLPQSEWTLIPVESYSTDFDSFDDFPQVDLMSSVPQAGLGALGDYGISQHADVETYKYLSLPSVLKQSMMTPLQAQINLVNKSIVDYFFVELKLEEHFEALRRYLFMEDGDFSQILSDSLLDKLASNPLPQEMLNPVFLNGVLKKSLQSSMNSSDKYAENLTFFLKFIPNSFVFNAHDTLDCLELRYKAEWPINIILTDTCMSKYGLVFSFMLQLKRIVWVLKDVWYRLKRDSLIKKAGNSPQFRQLQLFRQEMQHLVKVIQGYIANQIIHVTWKEFQDSLSKDVHDLDDLYKVHGQYLEKAVFRCLLTKNAKPVMKIIQDIFSLILKFRAQLLNGNWRTSGDSSQMVHSNFNQVSASYNAFRQYSVFLFEVVNKLAIRGYQPHLQELLLRLNFNSYYKD